MTSKNAKPDIHVPPPAGWTVCPAPGPPSPNAKRVIWPGFRPIVRISKASLISAGSIINLVDTPPLPSAPSAPNQPIRYLIPAILATALIFFLAGLFLGKSITIPGLPTTPASVSTPTPPAGASANWQTYTDQMGVVSFRYPSHWTLEKNDTLNPDTGSNILVSIKDDLPAGYLERNSDQINQTNLRTIAIAGKEVKSISITQGTSPNNIDYLFIPYSENRTLLVRFYSDDPPDGSGKRIFHQILSTFIFTDQLSPTPVPLSTQLLPTTNWQTASNSTISLKYPGDIYTAQTNAESIQLISKSTPTNRPDFLVYSYDGGSRRVWYNNFYSYYPGEVKFTEKQFGPVSTLYALYSQPPSSNDNYLISSGKMIVLVVPQGADKQVLETIISTLKFSSSSPTAWKYFNEDYSERDRNFRFKYPANLTAENVDSGSVELKSGNTTIMYIEEFYAFTRSPGDSLDEKLSNWLTNSNNPKLLSSPRSQFINSNNLVVYKITVSGEAICGGGSYNQSQWFCYVGAINDKGFTLADMNNFSEVSTLLKSVEFK